MPSPRPTPRLRIVHLPAGAAHSTPAHPPVPLQEKIPNPTQYPNPNLTGPTHKPVHRADAPAPIGLAAPTLPPIAAAIPHVRPEPDKLIPAAVGDALPA